MQTLLRARGRAVLAAWGLFSLAGSASAQDLASIGKTLTLAEGEARQIESTLGPVRKEEKHSAALHERRLIDAKLAYRRGVEGNAAGYEEASLLLFDLVEGHPESRSHHEAIYFLADSLFHKGDLRTSQKYFRKLAADYPTSEFYQDGLMRLVELSLKLEDPSDIGDNLAKLEAVPVAKRKPAVAYVLGKYAYFSKDYDKAARIFDAIPKTHPYYFQARYFSGVVRVAQEKYALAAKYFSELMKAQANTEAQRDIRELARMGLGRVLYQDNKAAKAIDVYQGLDRKSRYWGAMMYEIAWTYVRAGEPDRALRAIDLLILQEEETALQPEVRLLEGNLRIRLGGKDSTQYNQADKTFTETRDKFEKPKVSLDTMLAQHTDPEPWFRHLFGRSSETFDVKSMNIPAVASSWVKQKPEVQKVVQLVGNLNTIRADLADAEAIIARIESATSPQSRIAIRPELAKSRGRLYELRSKVSIARQQLLVEERKLIATVAQPSERAELDKLTKERAAIEADLARLPMATDSYEVRVAKSKKLVDAIGDKAARVLVEINHIDATLVALQKYVQDPRNKTQIDPKQFEKEMAAIRADQKLLSDQYELLSKQLQEARDQAVAGGVAAEEVQLRDQLAKVLDREHQLGLSLQGRLDASSQQRVREIGTTLQVADRADSAITRADLKIDTILDAALVDIKAAVATEKANLEQYLAQLSSYDGESIGVGSDVVRNGFVAVARDFYDIIVRADIGIIDVAWAQKEESSNRVSRLNLQLGNERRVLREDFRDVLQTDAGKDKKEKDE